MNTPDLTKAQLLVLVRTILAVLVAFGVGLNPDQQTALLALVGTLGTGTLLADAIIRHGRARALSPGLNVVNTQPARRTSELDAVARATIGTPPPAPAAAPAMAAPAGTAVPGFPAGAPQPIPGT